MKAVKRFPNVSKQFYFKYFTSIVTQTLMFNTSRDFVIEYNGIHTSAIYRTYFFPRRIRLFFQCVMKKENAQRNNYFFRFSKLIGPSSIAFQTLKRVVKMLISSGAETQFPHAQQRLKVTQLLQCRFFSSTSQNETGFLSTLILDRSRQYFKNLSIKRKNS